MKKHLTEPLPQWRKEREEFYNDHFGPTKSLLHARGKEAPGIDVHVIGPNEERQDHSLLITNGLSGLWMEAPPAVPESKRRVELILYCPALEIAAGAVEMPLAVQLIQQVAAMPRERHTYLAEFMAMPFSTPPRPIAPSSKLTTAFLLPPMFEDEAVHEGLALSGEERVTFLWLDFLTTAEYQFRSANSASAMLKKFQERQHSPILDVSRASYV